MYSLLPALVSGLFLAYGIYVVAAKGINRITISFFVLCIATLLVHHSFCKFPAPE
jgi:two-component system, CAI-1 autoinducer sensor kinase/phosphatase CqsS